MLTGILIVFGMGLVAELVWYLRARARERRINESMARYIKGHYGDLS